MLGANMLVFLLIVAPLVQLSYSSYLVRADVDEFKPTWESLDSRPIPQWYDKAKIGIFIHWGVFSVPSFGSEWFWMSWKGRNQSSYVDFMKKTYPNTFSYQEFAKDFTAEFFNPEDWAKLFKKSGARYVVLTSKHHEGYTLWPSKYSFSWNSVDVGPHRDIIDELSNAVRKAGMSFGLYHSLYEWFNPLYLEDKSSNFTKANFVHQKIIPEMKELIENYKPDILWSDGDWEASDEYWQSKEFLAWLFNDSPVKEHIVVNDRWGVNITCKHGDFYTCMDRFNPGVLIKHKWENAMTIDKDSWGFRRNAKLEDYLTTDELITTIAETISCGGNILMNVGPTKDGIIAPIYQQRLMDVGTWLEVNGDAIYESIPWIHQNDTISHTWYTSKDKTVYAITLDWPNEEVLKLGAAVDLFKTVDSVNLLGYNQKLKWRIANNAVEVTFPKRSSVNVNWAWVLKIKSK